MKFTVLCFLLISYLTVHCDCEEDDYEDEDDYEEEDSIDLEAYLPRNAKKGPDGTSECCPINRQDCKYLNITKNLKNQDFTSLICVGCGKIDSKAKILWEGPNNTDVKQMTSVTTKDTVELKLNSSTFFMKEIIVSNEEYNRTEFVCKLIESDIKVRQTILSNNSVIINNSSFFMKSIIPKVEECNGTEPRVLHESIITITQQLLLRHVLKV